MSAIEENINLFSFGLVAKHMDEYELLEQVKDRDSFLRFVHALMLNREDAAIKERRRPSSVYNNPVNGWQNTLIESYLERALSWGESGLPAEPSWKAFAIFLYCGKIYE